MKHEIFFHLNIYGSYVLAKSDLNMCMLTYEKMFSTDGRFGFQDFFKQTLLPGRTENSLQLCRLKS